jgi:tetratricopeptide (TPR) repeat protein
MANSTDKEFFEDLGDFDLKSLADQNVEYKFPKEFIDALAKGDLTQREVLGATPESIQNVARFGYSLLEHGHFAHAAHLFDGLIHLDPKVAYFHIGLATALKNLGQVDAAIETWEIAKALDPSDLTPYINQAQAYLELGRKDEARQLFERIRELDPKELHPFAPQVRKLWVAHFVPA